MSFSRLTIRSLQHSILAQPRFLVNASLAIVAAFGIGLEAAKAAPTPTLAPPSNTNGGDVDETGLAPRIRGRKKSVAEIVLPVHGGTGELLPLTGKIIVKFNDELGVRAPMGDSSSVMSLAGADMQAVTEILAQHKGTLRQWINKSPARLRAIEVRAENYSGRHQPDLASIVEIENVAAERLLDVARAFQALDSVEWANIDLVPAVHQQGCDAMNPVTCNEPNIACPDPRFFNCNPDPGGQNPIYGCADAACCNQVGTIDPTCVDDASTRGWDFLCAAIANLQCIGQIYDSSSNPQLTGYKRYDACFTSYLLRAETPGGICAGGGGWSCPEPNVPADPPGYWPGSASVIGADWSAPGVPADPLAWPSFIVNNVQQGLCFEAHGGAGCSQPSCCAAVCLIDPTCCNTQAGWDSSCVNLAIIEPACVGNGVAGPTPDTYVPFPATGALEGGCQFYLNSRFVPEGGFPDPANNVWTGIGSYNGRGYDLTGMATWQQQFADYYQGGAPAILYGESIKVAVIEFAAFTQHEEFVRSAPPADPADPAAWANVRSGPLYVTPRVIPEAGQTIVLMPQNEPQHGTATLGEIVAGDNQFGVTGIAKNAQGYFFPIVSAEEGGRAQNALTSCWETLGAGDVVNNSWGYPGIGPMDRIEPLATLVRVGSDLGVTQCCSAGNDGIAIANAPFDTGAIIVGAAGAGGEFNPPGQCCRLSYVRQSFSNYTNPEAENGTVHCFGWGTAVCTTGYGALFRGLNDPTGIDANEDNMLRTYTTGFNGTSSAAPIVSGMVAILQGWSKQLYGAPLAPEQIRGSLVGAPQCDVSRSMEIEGANVPDNCCVVPGGCNPDDCDCFLKDIKVFPLPIDSAYSILSSGFYDGDLMGFEILTGTGTPPITNFKIRAQDQNYNKVSSTRMFAGTRVEGFTYLGTGWTTDVRCRTPNTEPVVGNIFDLRLDIVARATRTPVLLIAYMYNHDSRRNIYIGNQILGPADATMNFDVPGALGYNGYVGPDNEFVIRIYTLGLGAIKQHATWYDYIDLAINEPLIPVP